MRVSPFATLVVYSRRPRRTIDDKSSQEARMDSATRPGSTTDPTVQSSATLSLKSRQDIEQEIQRRVEEERRRLEHRQRNRDRAHFHRPIERPFTAAERNRVTILFGGLTWKHEWLIRSVFQ